jgi:hypothetical protein
LDLCSLCSDDQQVLDSVSDMMLSVLVCVFLSRGSSGVCCTMLLVCGGVCGSWQQQTGDWCLWQAAERQALEDDLHIKLGHQLFAAAEYEQAMVRPIFLLPSHGM